MKGTIFVELLQLIEDEHGADTLDDLLCAHEAELTHGGAYTAVGNYPHGELLTLIGAYSAHIDAVQAESLLSRFAHRILQAFTTLHPEFTLAEPDLFQFLLGIQTHIHAEVLKLYADAQPPTIVAEQLDAARLQLDYRSHRPLAQFFVCMTEQSIEIFQADAQVEVVELSADGHSARVVVHKAA